MSTGSAAPNGSRTLRMSQLLATLKITGRAAGPCRPVMPQLGHTVRRPYGFS